MSNAEIKSDLLGRHSKADKRGQRERREKQTKKEKTDTETNVAFSCTSHHPDQPFTSRSVVNSGRSRRRKIKIKMTMAGQPALF